MLQNENKLRIHLEISTTESCVPLIRKNSGVCNLFQTMYLFSISTDEHVPSKYLLKKRLSKITKIHKTLMKLLDF